MNIFEKIGKSVWGPEYYQETTKNNLGLAFKYYFSFSALLALVITVLASLIIVPIVVPFLRGAGEQIVSYYPAELEVIIKDGKASTNVPEPYTLPLPAGIRFTDQAIVGSSTVENLLVIDTRTPFSVEQFTDYKTAVLLKGDSIYYYSKYESGGSGARMQTSFAPLKDVPNITINKILVSGLVTRAMPYLKWATPALIPLVFIAVFVVMLFHLIYLLFAAFCVWVVAKIRGLQLTYGQSYAVSLHAITAPLLLLLVLVPLGSSLFPFGFTILLVLLAHLNLKKAEEIINTSEETPTEI